MIRSRQYSKVLQCVSISEKKAHVFVKFFASQAAVAAECGLKLSSSSVSVSRKKCRGSYTYYTIATKQLGQKTAVNKEGVEHTLSQTTHPISFKHRNIFKDNLSPSAATKPKSKTTH